MSLDYFVCPSNRKAAATTTANAPQKVGPSDYRGNMGAGTDPTGNYCATLPSACQQTPCVFYDNGVMFMNSQVTIADISDGASQTMLMGETLQGNWGLGTDCCVRTDLNRFINQPINVGGVNYYTYWMSKHPGLVNFAKCDGSVSSVTSQINRTNLVKMMTRNGGEAVSADQTK